MTLLLAGDIGGTKTILELVELAPTGKLHRLHQETYPSQEYADLVPMIEQFLASAAQTGEMPKPDKACLAIAGPVLHNTAKLTNLPWVLETGRLQQELGIAQIRLINDFAAVGYGVLGLQSQDIHTLQTGELDPSAPIAVIGAGTGLGEGFLIRLGDDRYQVFPSEGGHIDFSPRNALEFELQQYLLRKYELDRVSVERVVSGQGVVAIYQFLRDRQELPESPELSKIVKAWEQDQINVSPAAAISKAAQEKSDRLSQQTLKLFIEAYGAAAGNLALKLLPYGGLYIAGGIAVKNLTFMQEGSFLEAFSAKGRISPLMTRIPIHIILNEQVGLLGAAICAARF